MTDEVGERLLALRQMTGWSREQLARRVNDRHGLGWYQSTVQKNETGGRRLTLDDLEALVDVFGRSGIDDLLRGGDDEAEFVEVDGVGMVARPTPDERMVDSVDSARLSVLWHERDFYRDRIAEIEAELERRREPPGGWEHLPTEDEEG